jgi:hypothetical protein
MANTSFLDYPITWRGETWIAQARIQGRKVSIASLTKAGSRDAKTFVAAPDEDSEDMGGGDGQKATALSALPPEERAELFRLVYASAQSGRR